MFPNWFDDSWGAEEYSRNNPNSKHYQPENDEDPGPLLQTPFGHLSDLPDGRQGNSVGEESHDPDDSDVGDPIDMYDPEFDPDETDEDF